MYSNSSKLYFFLAIALLIHFPSTWWNPTLSPSHQKKSQSTQHYIVFITPLHRLPNVHKATLFRPSPPQTSVQSGHSSRLTCRASEELSVQLSRRHGHQNCLDPSLLNFEENRQLSGQHEDLEDGLEFSHTSHLRLLPLSSQGSPILARSFPYCLLCSDPPPERWGFPTPLERINTLSFGFFFFYIKNPAYGRQRISRPMRIVGLIQI